MDNKENLTGTNSSQVNSSRCSIADLGTVCQQGKVVKWRKTLDLKKGERYGQYV